jgi:hypothetical protein
LTAQYTTAQRYTIGIFRTNIMKTSSQTSTRGVYAPGTPLVSGCPAARQRERIWRANRERVVKRRHEPPIADVVVKLEGAVAEDALP